MNEQRVEVDSSTYPFLAHAKPRPGQLEMIQDGIVALAKGGFHLAAAAAGGELQGHGLGKTDKTDAALEPCAALYRMYSNDSKIY